MSKLIFPDRGGVLVDDRTEVVGSAELRTRRGVYEIRVVKYPSYFKPYGYHYLDPDGSVTGGSSGNSHEPEEALQRAEKSIRDHERTLRLSRRSPSLRESGRMKKAVAFFAKYSGSDRKGSERLARAEKIASDSGWEVEWHDDPDEYQLAREDEEMPSEVLYAVLKDEQGNVLTSLGGIGDPDANYRRVVEAELALEALS